MFLLLQVGTLAWFTPTQEILSFVVSITACNQPVSVYLWYAGYLQTIRGKTRYTHFSNLSSHHSQARLSFGGRCPWATCSAPQPRTGNRQSQLTAHSHAPPALCLQRCRRSSQGSLSSGPGQRTRACCSCHCAEWHGMEATFCGISCRAEGLGHNMVSMSTIRYRPNTITTILEW